MNIRQLSFRNITTLMSGNIGAQCITFLSGLILARIYTPEEFGILGIFLSISNILIPISCFGYEAAIVSAKDIREAFILSILCFILCIIFSCILLVPIIVFKFQIISLFNCTPLYPWIYLLPISVLMGGIFNILNYFNTKLKQYKNISLSNVLKSFSCAIIQLLGYFIKQGPGMLIIGQTSMNIFGNFQLIRNIREHSTRFKLTELLTTGKKFIRYPKFYLWGLLANNISLNATNLLIKRLFSTADVGFYSYAYKYIGFPISLIATSSGQVYYQELSEAKLSGKSMKKVYNETFLKLLLLGIPIFLGLYLFIKPIFVLIFGETWSVAGEIAQILSPLFFIRFITSPLTMSLLVLDKQKYLLFWQCALMLATLLPYIVVKLYGGDIYSYIYSAVISLSTCYILYFLSILSFIYKTK